MAFKWVVPELHSDKAVLLRDDYLMVNEPGDAEFAANLDFLRLALEDAPAKITRDKLRADWPPDLPKPALGSLWRWLDVAVASNLVHRDGAGRKADPFRYWLPHKLIEWADDPLHALPHPEPLDFGDGKKVRRGR